MTALGTTRPPWLDRPLFIVGTGRSGATLLLSLLDADPGLISGPNEFAYYTA
jgi:LPS sulfotransferase NodH